MDSTYFGRRAAQERSAAKAAADPRARRSHELLAMLHSERRRGPVQPMADDGEWPRASEFIILR